jgi:hypothetical protein
MNPKIVKLLHEGFSMNTLENLTENQLNVLFNKIVSEQPKPVEKTVTSKVIELPSGAKTAIGGATVSNDAGKTVITTTAEGEFTEGEQEDVADVNKGEDDQDPIQKQGPDGMDEGNINEKAVSKQQQKIMGLALSVKKGDTPKSKVSKKVQDMSKEMSKKDLEDFASTKHKGLPKKVEATESSFKGYGSKSKKNSTCPEHVSPSGKKTTMCPDDDDYEINYGKRAEKKNEVEKLEESILKIIENHLPPHTTKSELLNYIRRNK